MLILSREQVAALLDIDELVHAVAAAMVDVSAGRVSMPARVAATVVERHALLAAMPAFLPSAGALTTKLVSVFPENRDGPTHQALICCFDAASGEPTAVFDGSHITAARTAAGSRLATTLLARRGSGSVAVIGTGVQARAHSHALWRCDGIHTVRVAGRNAGAVTAVVGELRRDGVNALSALSIPDAVRSADIVCATTHAAEPVLLREWVRPGTHINSVGYNVAGTGEVDTEVMRDARVVVESREAVLAAPPSGAVEVRTAIARGLLRESDLIEVGEIASGKTQGRIEDGQITLYKSVGVAAQDAAAAALVLAAARARGIGHEVAM